MSSILVNSEVSEEATEDGRELALGKGSHEAEDFAVEKSKVEVAPVGDVGMFVSESASVSISSSSP